MPKHAVKLDETGLRVDGKLCPVVSGQFEFWRHHSLYWRPILRVMRESGLDMVSTFVCWDFHEVAPRDFDFTGRTYPSRDLSGFLDLCAEEGFQVVMRIGPYIDAEWPTRGPAPDVAALERLHPRYQERTQEYVQALAPILTPRLASNGGPIVLMVLDCEIYFPRATSAATDSTAGYVQVPYDRELVTSRYRTWLARRYRDDTALARSWSTAEAKLATATEPDYRRAGLHEVLDSFEFMTDAVRESLEHLRTACVKAGIGGVPFSTSNKNLMHFIDWRSLESVIDSHGLVVFFPNLWPGDQKLVVSWYLRLFRARIRFAWAAEFLGGASEGRASVFGLLGLDHARFTSLLAMAMGLRGLSYYMFVDRDNSLYSPVSPIGQVRPNLAGFRDAIRVAKELRPDRQVADVGLLWSMDHHRCHVAGQLGDWRALSTIGMMYDQPKELAAWWETFRELQTRDVDFELAPLDQDLDRFRVLIYAGPDFLRQADLERLGRWVERGGTLVMVTAIPTRDVDGTDLSELAARVRSGRGVLFHAWGGLDEVLARVGGHWAIRAESPGVWTFAYRDEGGFTLFVANVGTMPVLAGVRLGPELAAQVQGRAARDLLSGEEWKVPTGGLWNPAPTLPVNTVRCIRIPT
jgi:beta-galactosidase GanA